MQVQAIKTPLIKAGDDLFQAIAASLPTLPERSVLVVTSKIVSTSENRFVPKVTGERQEKYDLVKQEADFYTEPHSSKYDLMLSIKNNWMFMFAGIDESNADNQYLLWPKDPQASAVKIWEFLRSHYGVKEVGVTISDSASLPLNWGVVGHGIAYAGFEPLKSYIGKPDLFGRLMKMEQVNVMQSLTTAGVWEMGEGAESTPLALITNLNKVVFQDHAPTVEELANLKITLEDDAYEPILSKADWKKGGGGHSS